MVVELKIGHTSNWPATSSVGKPLDPPLGCCSEDMVLLARHDCKSQDEAQLLPKDLAYEDLPPNLLDMQFKPE